MGSLPKALKSSARWESTDFEDGVGHSLSVNTSTRDFPDLPDISASKKSSVPVKGKKQKAGKITEAGNVSGI